jgi:hypothetical protein
VGLEERNGASRTAEHAAAGPSSAAGDRGVTEVFFAFLESTGGAVSSLVDIYGDRLRTSTKETMWKVGIAIVGGVAALLWIGSATLAAVRGLCGAVASLLGGEAWLGDLIGGLLALALAAGAMAAAARWSRSKQLRSLELKYGKHDTNDAGADTTGVPGSPAAVGDPTAAHGAARAR